MTKSASSNEAVGNIKRKNSDHIEDLGNEPSAGIATGMVILMCFSLNLFALITEYFAAGELDGAQLLRDRP